MHNCLVSGVIGPGSKTIDLLKLDEIVKFVLSDCVRAITDLCRFSDIFREYRNLFKIKQLGIHEQNPTPHYTPLGWIHQTR